MLLSLQLLGGLLAAQASLAAISVEQSHKLLSCGNHDVMKWIAEHNGYMNKNQEGRRSAATAPQDVLTMAKGTMTGTPPTLYSDEKAYCFGQPRSHFDASNNQTFCQRYTFFANNYKPGGPIIMLDPGEQTADGLFSPSYMSEWAEKLNGIYIVLEHRYYGWSIPVPDFTTDNMRFLSIDEALEDTANFIRNWVPPPGTLNLTDPSILRPDKTPWFFAGGSYPGGRAVWMRKKYPDLVYGSISSSGVTTGIDYFWQYHNATIAYGPPACVAALEASIKVIDSFLDMGGMAAAQIKALFGLEELPNPDFAYRLSLAWDAQTGAIGTFDDLCERIMAPRPANESSLVIAGTVLSAQLRNFGEAVYNNADTQACREGLGIAECFDFSSNTTMLSSATDTDQEWRPWQWQMCTEFGYFVAAPPPGERSIVSKYNTYDYLNSFCPASFPAGTLVSLPAKPDLEAVSKYGGLNITADRVIFVGGDRDPWRPATPLSDAAPIRRVSTDLNPLVLVQNATHCPDFVWRESRFDELRDFEYFFIQKWSLEFTAARNGTASGCIASSGSPSRGFTRERD